MVRIPDAKVLGGLKATREKTNRRVKDLERTDGSQYARALQKITELVAGLADQVQTYIGIYSYTRAQIQGLGWLTPYLPPSKGGTGTTNAYNNTFTSGAWRSTWALTDGTLGYAPSLRALKRDIRDAVIDVTAWLSLPVQAFRYRADVEENGEQAGHRLGFIAEDLEAAGLEEWLYRDEAGALQGVAYELLPLAHHEIIRAHESRIADLEATAAAQSAIITQLSERLYALDGGGTL